MYINNKTFETITSSVIPKGIDWVKVPDETESIGGDMVMFKWNGDTYDEYYASSCFAVEDGVKLDTWFKGTITDLNNCQDIVWSKGKDNTNYSETSVFNPLVPQEGGDHYKLRPIQPIEYSERNGLSMCQGNIIKYITRHKEKNKVGDLAKVVHYALLEAYFVYGESGSTELKEKILKLLGEC